jgi:hypothetical protein
MAMKFIAACVLVASLAELIEAACDVANLQGQMSTCQMKLGTGGGDLCSRYSAYTNCVDNMLASCPSSVKSAFTSAMQSATAAYSSQLTKCTSSESGSVEKPSGSSGSSSSSSQGTSCSSAELQQKSSGCIQEMTAAAAGGNVCGAWQTYECCLTTAFASCGSDMQGQISTMMSTMKVQYDAILPGLSKCAAAACSSESQPGASSTPVEVETTLMAIIQISDPLAFDVDKYVEAVKKATGVEQLPEAVVKAFEIIVKYVLPDATVMVIARAAIAKANNVLENQVQITQSSARRLGAGRRLGMNVDVTIIVPDQSKAAAVQTSAANATVLESELGGAVSVAKAPATNVKVETKVRSKPSVAGQLVSQIESAGSDIGGTIKAEVKSASPEPSFNGAPKSFSMALAAVSILLGAVF